MSLTDPIDVHLELAKEELESGTIDAFAGMTVAGVLSLIPGAGSAIQRLLDGRARANVDRRWLELFIEMRKRIEEIRDSIPDPDFYGSEDSKLFSLWHRNNFGRRTTRESGSCWPRRLRTVEHESSRTMTRNLC